VTDPETLRRLMEGDELARLVLTDEPYNVPIVGHVTSGGHREFAMASGEMSDAEFRAFNEAWMIAALPCLCDGGVFGTFIDWRGCPTVNAAAVTLGLKPRGGLTFNNRPLRLQMGVFLPRSPSCRLRTQKFEMCPRRVLRLSL
jgi:hypothetical protein